LRIQKCAPENLSLPQAKATLFFCRASLSPS
jgi:hypothetical protein